MKSTVAPQPLEKGIWRICVPFEDIYTSVFVLKAEQGVVLLDTASYPEDGENYIIPALNDLKLSPDIILCSHFHGDHCGALESVSRHYPNATIGSFDKTRAFVNLNESEILFNRFQVLNLKGHTEDCLAVLDTKTLTLISCDCLQQQGISHFGTFFEDFDNYINTLERIKKLKLNRIITAHDYVPFGFDIKKDKIEECLKLCQAFAEEIKAFATENSSLSPETAAKLFNQTHNLPPISPDIIKVIRKRGYEKVFY